MTTGTFKSQGTQLYWVDDTIAGGGTSDPEIMRVDCITGIQGLGGPADNIEITCFDTVGDKEFVPGLGNPADMTVPFNFIKGSIAHRSLIEMKKNGNVVKWAIAMSDSASPMTVDSDGNFTRPAARSCFFFSGSVKDLNFDFGTNDIVRGTVTILRSGAVSYVEGT